MFNTLITPAHTNQGQLKGSWGGNTVPGQLKDSSGLGNDLTKIGDPNNVSTPTPLEGDKWLSYHPTKTANTNYYAFPTTALPLTNGRIDLDFVADVASAPTITIIISLRSTPIDTSFGVLWLSSPANTLYLEHVVGGSVKYSVQVPMTPSSSKHHLTLDYGSTGAAVYLDGKKVASSTTSVTFDNFNLYHWLGGNNAGAVPWYVGGYDNVQTLARFTGA